jgi:hypothetical protein
MTFLKLHDWVEEDKINWSWMSGNPSAIHLLEANPDKIYWPILSENKNAVSILETNLDKVDWNLLSGNPSAIHILETNLDKVKWIVLSMNPGAIRMLNANIFTYDYDAMKSSHDALAEDLMKERFHPKHIDQFESWGFD